MAYNQGYYQQGGYQQQGYNTGWQQPQYGQQQYTGQYAAPTPDPYMNQSANNWAPPPGVPMYAGQAPDAYAMNSQWGQQQAGYAAGYQQQTGYYGQYPAYQQPGYAQPAYATPQQGYSTPQQGYSPYPTQAGYASGGASSPTAAAYATPQASAYPAPVQQAIPESSAPPYSPPPQVVPQVPRMESVAPVAQAPPMPEASAPPALMAQPTVSSPPPLMQQPTVGSAPPALMQQPTVSASSPSQAGSPAAASVPPMLQSTPSLKSQQSMSSVLRGGIDTDVSHAGRLFLEVVGGRNLKNMELFGKQDPYMKLNFKAYKLRTKTHQSGGRAPVWNQTFSFELDGKDPDIAIECFDEDTTKDDFIGGASVNIQQIVNGKGSEVWVPIANKKGVNTGEVAFKAKFAQYRPAILKFKLTDAKGLPCPDARKLDPYVIFYVDGDKANKVLAKSRVHKGGGSNPVWNQDFNFKLTGREQFLDLDVWDEDVAADDHCGNARLRFVDLRQAAAGPLRFPLTRPGKQSTASIGVSVEFVPV